MLDCGPVGATRRTLAIACALVLAIAPAASASARANGDLTVTVSRLDVPAKIQSGKRVTFAVRYIVSGPATRRAMATVVLDLRGASTYHVTSLPARVRPAIWKWAVTDTLPVALSPGRYKAVVTITLTRQGKAIATTTRTQAVLIS